MTHDYLYRVKHEQLRSQKKIKVPLPELVHLSFKAFIFWFRVIVTAEVVIGDGHAGSVHFRLFSDVRSLSRAYEEGLSFVWGH